MELTKDTLERYVGGIMDIHFLQLQRKFKGDIASISLKEALMKVRFNRLKKAEGNPIRPPWVRTNTQEYTINLPDYFIEEMKSAEEGRNGEIRLTSQLDLIIIYLFPSDHGNVKNEFVSL